MARRVLSVRHILVHNEDVDDDQTITVSELQHSVLDQVCKLTQGGKNPTVRRENLEYDFAVS